MNDHDPGVLSDQDFEYLSALRSRGFAVSVFNPEELGNCDEEDIEDSMIEAGRCRIEYENSKEAP